MEQHQPVCKAHTRRERRDARENRQRLLEAAKQLFAAQGVAATTMKEIGHAAGVGPGTLYRHFADKGELCRALIKDDIAVFQARVGARIEAEASGSPLARLDILLTTRVEILEAHLPLFAAIDEALAGPRHTGRVRGPFDSWVHDQTVQLLGEALATGEVALLDPVLTADTILAAVSPPLYRYQRHTCGYSRERIIAGLRRLFVDGLRQLPIADSPT
ncbi:MAG: TetR/AcrR family transcriptional regulator [Thermomicrobiales bacterium]|jgi:AcrR family transcriptional regulator|nr:TetR/AcrR family transcriptional regulator [Thermomicrobiales bacterium]